MDANWKKNIIYSIVLLAMMYAVYLWRNRGEELKRVEIQGETMGTTYSIVYLDKDARDFKIAVDSLLQRFNLSLSTYIPESEISRFNRGDSLQFESPFFYPVIKRSVEIWKSTNGAFNPTVMPLVKAWGFGPSPKDSLTISKAIVDSLLNLVDMESIQFDEKGIRKTKKNVQLDFNAIAQGYGTDVVAQYLDNQGIANYMVEIGGEVLCKGKNDKKQTWLIGISNPNYEEKGGDEAQALVRLDNRALATSGNYRKFYVKDGKRYSHTISPSTGYPVSSSLLSASVFAKDAMTADAYATALMVMGLEKSLEFVKNNNEIEVFLVYDDNGQTKTYSSPMVENYFVK